MRAEYFEWLKTPQGGSCTEVKDIGNGLYAAIKPLLYHWTMIAGEIGDIFGYEDRWCYATQELAEKALREWDGNGEPTGWHRHPATGRRRPDRDAEQEYVAP